MNSPARRPYAVLAGAAAAVFAVLAALVETTWPPLADLDAEISRAAHRSTAAHPWWADVNLLLTDWVWDPMTLRLVVAAVAILLWLRGARRAAVWAGCTVLAGGLLGAGLKLVFRRPRPAFADPVATADGWSLPSGHALTGMLAAGALLALVLPRLRTRWMRVLACALAVVTVVGVGWTRIAVGVHYLSDVVAGWALGLAVLAGSAALWRWAAARTPPEPDAG